MHIAYTFILSVARKAGLKSGPNLCIILNLCFLLSSSKEINLFFLKNTILNLVVCVFFKGVAFRNWKVFLQFMLRNSYQIWFNTATVPFIFTTTIFTIIKNRVQSWWISFSVLTLLLFHNEFQVYLWPLQYCYREFYDTLWSVSEL